MACVATAPTPASAQSTPLPTEKTRDCTAPPTSPVTGSKPRMEKVATGSCVFVKTEDGRHKTKEKTKDTRPKDTRRKDTRRERRIVVIDISSCVICLARST